MEAVERCGHTEAARDRVQPLSGDLTNVGIREPLFGGT